MTARLTMPAPSAEETASCPICGAATESAGSKFGVYARREFHFRHCPSCHFSFLADPWTDYAAIYDQRYYRGEGADPFVAYYDELEHPAETVRHYEWEGIIAAVNSFHPLTRETRWLDFGCGHGGLVRHAAAQVGCRISGHDTGEIVDDARKAGIAILDEAELGALDGQCDVVTAIEVLEHVSDPVAVLRRIRALLKPGGLFFYTTGNARPFRGRITSWGYAIPEVHMSFFEPGTLAHALRAAGFRVEFPAPFPGLDQIIRFKVLKQLGFRRRGGLERLFPWPLICPTLRRRLEIGARRSATR